MVRVLDGESSSSGDYPIHISHALNGGEYKVTGTNYRCDGFVKPLDGMGTIYEFYGKKLIIL